jgi:parvulin-like peptidyl-prolyl isomerase
VQLTDVREAGIQPLDDIKQQLRQKLLVDKKMDKLKARAEDLAAKLQAQGIDAAPTIDPTAEVRVMTQLRNNGQLQGFGNEFDATQAAFKVPVGNVSKAIRGNRAWFVIQPTSRQEADMSKFAAERTFTVQTLSGTAKNAAYSLWFQKLREHAEIEDLRYQRD